jgi:hypothetical protein
MNVPSSLQTPLIGILTALLFGVGCRGDSRAAASVEIRDSAVVHLVPNSLPHLDRHAHRDRLELPHRFDVAPEVDGG